MTTGLTDLPRGPSREIKLPLAAVDNGRRSGLGTEIKQIHGNYIRKIFRPAGSDTIELSFFVRLDTINENGSGSSLIVAASDTTTASRKISEGPVYEQNSSKLEGGEEKKEAIERERGRERERKGKSEWLKEGREQGLERERERDGNKRRGEKMARTRFSSS